MFYCIENLPVHINPSPMNPLWHLHEKLPTVLLHIALMSHGNFKHSSSSKKQTDTKRGIKASQLNITYFNVQKDKLVIKTWI